MEPDRLDAQGKPLPETKCPRCGHKLNCATVVDGDAGSVSPGDFSVCIGCAAVLRYTPDMTLREASQKELQSDLDTEQLKTIARAQLAIGEIKQREEGKQYSEQLEAMLANKRRWILENPGGEVAKVQFNYPANICLVAPISEAIKNSYVSANPAGLDLIKALWPWQDEREPTVMMVRVVLEEP